MEQDLVFSYENIGGELVQGEVRGNFTVESKRGDQIKGFLTCTDPRMKCTPLKFQGTKIEFGFCFNGKGMQPGEVIEGTLCFVSNLGERELPYTIRYSKPVLQSSLGEIRNLFHFANLARSSWDEAVKLFFHPDFEQLFSPAQEEEGQLYRGLKKTGEEQCVEEFLLAVRKKTPVTYHLSCTALEFKNIDEDERHKLQIERKGWGYTAVRIETDGNFFSLEKKELGETDFMGNVCQLPLYLYKDKLHQGKNYGRITLNYAYGSITIPITVSQNQHHRMRVAIEKRRSLKQMRVELTELYMDFRARRIAAPRWRKETEGLLEKMRVLDERNPQPRLFLAHLYITSDKPLEARWMLDRVGRNLQEEKDPVTYAYYLYLTTLIKEDEEYHQMVKEKVEGLYYTRENNWQIAWLMLYLSHDLHGHAQKKWDFLQEVFLAGCTSPVLYTEAIMLLNYQPTLLMELGPVELRILRFGQSRQGLSDEVKGVLQYLSLKEKEYSDTLFNLLGGICREEENIPMLQSLCSLLIKGNKKGKQYFPWYEKAVCAGLKITRLYEYYMMSLERNKEIDIPKMVLMYFSYESSLSYPNAAYLYRYVYENKDTMEELYLAYAPKIERFVLKQLHAGKINRDLGYLYEHILSGDMLTRDNAAALEKVMFLHSVRAVDEQDERLIVVAKHLEDETAYDFYQGKTRALLLGKNYLLLREDKWGQRFVMPKEEYPSGYLSVSALAQAIHPMVEEALGLALYVCEDKGDWQPIVQENENQFRFLSEHPGLLAKERQHLRKRLLDYYHEADEMGLLDNWLEECEWDALSSKEENKLIHYLIARGFYEKAYAFVQIYGPERISPKLLVRVSTYMLEDRENSTTLLWLIDSAFQRGKYNLPMLAFLAEHYKGTCRRLAALFRAARDFDVEVYSLSERLLTQILYSKEAVEEDLEAFKVYVAGGAKTPLEAAFLSWRSKEFVVKHRPVDGYFIRDIARVYKRGVKLHPINLAAYLKYFATHEEEKNQAEEEVLKLFLHELVFVKQWTFPFFMEYQKLPGMEILADKNLVYYEGKADEQVALHYAKVRREGEKEVYHKEFMDELYSGIFVKEFILFAGEKLKYYITREEENQEQLMENGVLTGKDFSPRQLETGLQSRYQRINHMCALEERGEYEQIEELLEEYWRLEYLTKTVFHL
ncbi:MAG: DUF5717 family protein [Lachnospiraceae bacterium]|nr:DUF5717 family protein [Lachnospiraceae bacterium]